MKVRSGFVSNSSSSSFVCEVCGEIASGWDMSMNDAEMVECVKGHTFCTSHVKEMTKEEKITWVKERDTTITDEEIEDDLEGVMEGLDYEYSFPSVGCPICNIDALTDTEVLDYCIAKWVPSDIGSCRKDIIAFIKTEFNSNHEEFKKSLNK